MAPTSIALKAKAGKLGIEGYRKMTVSELEAAIASAEGTTKGKGKAPAKGRANGAKGKGKARTAVSRAVKGKGKASTSTSAPAKGKSNAQKSSPGKGKATAAQGKAKRPTRKNVPARAEIDRTKIDWKAESGVGKTGKRKEVMDALRAKKGDYAKVFDVLGHRAKAFYPSKTKDDAERMLVWLINRVAFDFVMATGQHEPGERAAYGTSDAPQDIRRREAREAARKAAKSAQRKRTAAKGTGKGRRK